MDLDEVCSMFGENKAHDLLQTEMRSSDTASVFSTFDTGLADFVDLNESTLRDDLLERCFDTKVSQYFDFLPNFPLFFFAKISVVCQKHFWFFFYTYFVGRILIFGQIPIFCQYLDFSFFANIWIFYFLPKFRFFAEFFLFVARILIFGQLPIFCQYFDFCRIVKIFDFFPKI